MTNALETAADEARTAERLVLAKYVAATSVLAGIENGFAHGDHAQAQGDVKRVAAEHTAAFVRADAADMALFWWRETLRIRTSLAS